MNKRPIALLLALLMTLSMLPVSAMAEETGTVPMPTEEEETISSGLTLCSDEFTIENGVLLAYTGPTKVTEVTVPYGVTAIGDLAFYTRNRIMKINLPATVERIGYSAFAACYSLQEINLPEGLTYIGHHAFTSCHSLTSLKLPSTLTYIGKYAFSYCRAMEGEIVIADGVTELGENTFAECKKITGVTLPEGLTEIPDSFFMGCEGLVRVNLPDTIERIGEYAFGYCKSLKSLDLPENLCKLGRSAFQNCESLRRRLTIPDQLEDIPQRALADAGSIKELVIGKSVRVIYSAQDNSHAFYGMNSVTDVIFTGLTVPNNFPDGYEANKDLFTFMPNLQNVWVPEEACDAYLEVYGDRLPEGVQMLAGFPEEVDTTCGDNLEWSVENGVLTISGTGDMYDFGANGGPWAAQRDTITSVVIEEGVTSVGNYAFSNMGKITGVTMADTVKKIGEGAFYFCGKLASVTMPGVTAIGKQAFYSCDGLTAPIFPAGLTELAEGVYGGCAGFTEITIPEGITTIGAGAFEKCANLTSVSIPASVTDIRNRPFDSCTSLTAITVDENNADYTSVDGVLLGWFGGDLIQYPAGREEEYIVPESVLRVSDHAFRMAKTKSIRFTGEAPEIGDYVFENLFAEIRYPYGSEAWKAVTSQTYGGESITWIPCNPITGKDLVDTRLADLTDLDFMAFSQLAYRDFTNEEMNRPLEELVGGWRTNVWSKRDITYTELTENISDWMPVQTFSSEVDGYYAVLFANGFGEAVLAYRGSIAITKLFDWFTADQWDAIMDWLVNDFPMEVFDILSPQVYLALDTFDDVAADYPLDQLVTTGHSLGGTLANIAAAYAGIRSESVNAISSLDTVYSYEPAYMGENFTGVENWDIEDHANRYDILAGVYEAFFTTRLKPYTQHASIYGELSLGSNHSVDSMLDRNDSGNLMVTAISGGFRPTEPISTSLLTSLSMLKLGTGDAEKLTCYVTGALYNSLYGGSGNDTLIGGLMNDTLIGGYGDDRLDGGYGDDTYHYYEGHGSDTIYDISGADTLCLYGYASKYVTIESDDDFVKLYDGSRVIVKIDKNSRSSKASDFTLKFYPRGYHPENKYETVNIGEFFTANFAQRVAVGCPVDIEVLDSEGHVVYTVEDGTEGEYYTPYGSFYVYEEENGEYGKVLDLREGYSIRIRGLDNGTMTVSHWEADGDLLTDSGTVENVPVSENTEAELVRNKAGDVSLTDNQGEIYLLDNTQNVSPRGIEYTINNMLIFDETGLCDEIPTGPVTVSVAVSNDVSTRADTLILGLYSSDGRMVGMKTAVLDIKKADGSHVYIPLDNSDGEISAIRAFIVPTFRSMVPLAETMTVGDLAEEEPVIPEVPSVPGVVPGVPEVPIAPVPVVPVMAE